MRDKGEQSEQRKMKRVQKLCARMPIAGGILALIIGIVFLVQSTGGAEKEDGSFLERIKPEFRAEPIVSAAEQFPDLDIQEEFLTVNPYSRPGTELKNVKKIVIHYTANPGTSAQANRDYFEGLQQPGLHPPAVILLLAWMGKSYNACLSMRWHMHRMKQTPTVCLLNAVIRMTAENLQLLHIISVWN